ncbi:MAG TPA: hypothetical protein VF415_01455 [Rhodanobacter sp.]
MHRTFRSPQRIHTATALLWAAGLVAHGAWFTWSALSGPPSPDLYANHLSFVLVVFLLARVPLWLIGPLLMLIAEFAVLGRKYARSDTDSACD